MSVCKSHPNHICLTCKKSFRPRAYNSRFCSVKCLKSTHKFVRKDNLRSLEKDFDNKCGYCGNDLTYSSKHIDHIIPKSGAGTDEYKNLALSCEFCNMAKGSHDAIRFINWLAFVRSGQFKCKMIDHESVNQEISPTIYDKLQSSWRD